MATSFKPIVIAGQKKDDGSYNVKIRMIHNRVVRRIATNLYAYPEDLVKSNLKIKSETLLARCNQEIALLREKMELLGMGGSDLSADEVLSFLTDKQDRVAIKIVTKTDEEKFGFKLDFLAYGRKVAESKSKGTGDGYLSAINCLERFVKRERGINDTDSSKDFIPLTPINITLDISEVTATFLERFEAFIASEPVMCYSRSKGLAVVDKPKKGRALSLYMAHLRHIHNKAKWEFNDEDLGIIRIPQSPFAKYKMKKAPAPKPKPISTKSMQMIIDLPDFIRRDGPPESVVRRDLARDCFIISFGLAGMNAADMYDCEPQDFDRKENILTYGRKKTRTRRDDGAIMKIRVEPCILPLIGKYLSIKGDKLFVFSELYSSPDGFNNALKAGIEKISELLPEKEFVFYSARYSWATIGRSEELNIDKYTIHEGLNHVDEKMKITDGYIQKDFRSIWKANQAILGLFDWSAVIERESKRKKNELM